MATRHLKLFGYEPQIYYPKKVDKPLFNVNFEYLLIDILYTQSLSAQCKQMDIPFVDSLPALNDFHLIVDAIFGYSFSGEIRALFDTVLKVFQTRYLLEGT